MWTRLYIVILYINFHIKLVVLFQPDEWVHMDEKYFYMEHILRLCSVTHSIVAFFMLVAYYHLKVSYNAPLQPKHIPSQH